MLTRQVEDSLRAAQEHLRDALAFAARGEKPYVAKHIGSFLADIENLIDTQDLIEQMREGNGPRLIELVTYRHYGHVDWRDDIDVGVKRSQKDVADWKERDPITRLSKSLISEGLWSPDEEESFKEELRTNISLAWEKAMNDPYPDLTATMKYVFSYKSKEES